ncbi:MAG: hypothetical protein V7678_04520 [Brevundimonas sp.]
MSLPRMSIEALSARLHIENEQIVVVVEGLDDQRLLDRWASSEGLPVAIYSVSDIEVELAPSYAPLGGNKGRVVTLIASDQLVRYANDNLYGIVDRDLDDALGRTVNFDGLYYTTYSNLKAEALCRSGVSDILRIGFQREPTDELLDELDAYSRMDFKYRVWKELNGHKFDNISISSYVRKARDGGYDWDRYLSSTAVSRKAAALAEGRGALEHIDASGDVRLYRRDHSLIEFLWEILRKERFIDATVRIEELARHIRWLFAQRVSELTIAATIRRWCSPAI